MILKMVKRYAKKSFRYLTRSKNSKVRAWVLTYLLALAPANYATTALTTASNLTNPTQVMQVMKDKEALTSFTGLLNTATGGVLKPLTNGVLAAAGATVEKVGDVLGLEKFSQTGKEWLATANEWFSAGKAALGMKDSDSKDSNSGSMTNSAQNKIDNAISGISPGGQKISYAWNESMKGYYQVLGKAVTADKTVNKSSEFKYSDLDELGRSGIAEALITYADVEKSAGTREQFEKGSDPSGWGHNPKVSVKMTNGKIYNGFAWNRSHLIADSLGGRAYRNNLITGTRMQNVGANDSHGGMQYIERKVVDHLKSNRYSRVWYRVTPIYEKNELVPRVVVVDAQSDDGGINERVVTYNVLPGYTIDYMTGKIS